MHDSETIRVARIYKNLQVSNFMLEHMLKPDYDAIAVHSNGIIITANPRACEIFGYRHDELLGLNSWKLFTAESSSIMMDHVLTGSEEPYEAMALHKNGHPLKLALKGKNFTLDEENLRAVLFRSLI
ncbi:MAG: PAS domain S-box protein [Gammaproteobacteria bacterium]|nr:PAS domain S-box protein [Gammaproteobacteria bacterium]